jgi:hypothetical protein
MINIPNTNKQWKQANNSDLFGNIHVTKNISFDNAGYLSLANSSRVSATEALADFDNPASIASLSTGYLTATWDDIFTFPEKILTEIPVKSTATGVPPTDTETDTAWFGGLLVASQDTDVDYYTPGTDTWTDTNISLTGDGQHPVVNFLSQSALAIANVNTVKLYASPITATPTLITTLTIPADFEITGMCYLNQNLYIATQHVFNDHAFMFVWNGSGSAAQQAYEVDSNTLFNVVAHKNSIYGVSGNGSLLRFNGGGFDVVDAFPIFYTDQSITGAGSLTMYKNTLKSNGDVLYILFSNRGNDEKRLLNQPDGVWCYEEGIGLYHKYSLSNSTVIRRSPGTAGVDITDNTITVASPGIKTGTECYYSATTVIGGLKNETKYFAIFVDATHIKLATTKANALAGTAIDLTSTGDADNLLVFYPNVDYGQSFTEQVTCLSIIERPVANSQYGTDIIWGGEVTRRDNVASYGSMGTTSDQVEARGYFITPKIFSNEVTDVFNLFTLKYSPLTSELDKIIIKYRTVDDMKKYIDIDDWGIAWTSTTTFTTTQVEWGNAVVGDEIEVLRGAAGGLLAHITQIVNNSGTYTVTIDESFEQYTTGDIGVAVFRNWTKFAVIDPTNTLGYLNEKLDAKGKFIQFKVELRGLGVRIEELKVDNKYLLPAKN